MGGARASVGERSWAPAGLVGPDGLGFGAGSAQVSWFTFFFCSVSFSFSIFLFSIFQLDLDSVLIQIFTGKFYKSYI